MKEIESKGPVYLWLENNRIFLVEKAQLDTKIGEEISKITFFVEDNKTKEKLKMSTDVDSNLVHDLYEHASLNTADVFIIKQTGEHELTWKTYPAEELNLLLKNKEKKDLEK